MCDTCVLGISPSKAEYGCDEQLNPDSRSVSCNWCNKVVAAGVFICESCVLLNFSPTARAEDMASGSPKVVASISAAAEIGVVGEAAATLGWSSFKDFGPVSSAVAYKLVGTAGASDLHCCLLPSARWLDLLVYLQSHQATEFRQAATKLQGYLRVCESSPTFVFLAHDGEHFVGALVLQRSHLSEEDFEAGIWLVHPSFRVRAQRVAAVVLECCWRYLMHMHDTVTITVVLPPSDRVGHETLKREFQCVARRAQALRLRASVNPSRISPKLCISLIVPGGVRVELSDSTFCTGSEAPLLGLVVPAGMSSVGAALVDGSRTPSNQDVRACSPSPSHASSLSIPNTPLKTRCAAESVEVGAYLDSASEEEEVVAGDVSSEAALARNSASAVGESVAKASAWLYSEASNVEECQVEVDKWRVQHEYSVQDLQKDFLNSCVGARNLANAQPGSTILLWLHDASEASTPRVGFIGATFEVGRRATHLLVVQQIYVVPTHRRGGGSSLFSALLAVGERKGAAFVSLNSGLRDEHQSFHFWHKLGFPSWDTRTCSNSKQVLDVNLPIAEVVARVPLPPSPVVRTTEDVASLPCTSGSLEAEVVSFSEDVIVVSGKGVIDRENTNDFDGFLRKVELPVLEHWSPSFNAPFTPPAWLQERREGASLHVRVQLFDNLGSGFTSQLASWIRAVFPSAQLRVHAEEDLSRELALAGANGCSYAAAHVLATMLSSKESWFDNVCELRAAQRWVSDGNAHLASPATEAVLPKDSLSRDCVCHRRCLRTQLMAGSHEAHYLSGLEVLELVRHWSTSSDKPALSSSDPVQLHSSDSACHAIARAAQRFLRAEIVPGAYKLESGECVQFCCVNTESSKSEGSHWVVFCFGLSWSSAVLGPVEDRRTRPRVGLSLADMCPPAAGRVCPQTLPKAQHANVRHAPKRDARFHATRSTYGTDAWYMHHKGVVFHDNDGNKYIQAWTHGSDTSPSVQLVWRVYSVCGKEEICRHVVVAPSAHPGLGMGLYSWSSVFTVGSKIAPYSGKVVKHVSERAACEAASRLPPAQRSYAIICKRGGSWVTVDASTDKFVFTRFVNDPYMLFDRAGHPVLANCYFSPTGDLHTEHVVPAYDIQLPHHQNAASEFFVEYSYRDSYFKKERVG
jgi:hypothetical protein